MGKELNKLNLEEAIEQLNQKKITAEELVKDCLKAIDNQINAFITKPHEEEIIKKAQESDKRAKNNQRKSEIDGIPLAIKDNINIYGEKTTAGSKMLINFISPYDATVIKKLKQKGVILFGKTNMDEFACGSSTETSYFGPTLNPHNREYVPGGSSGGSAASVANNEVIAALGSDTGGSIRQPSSFCGIVGLKPTYGMVSRYGLLAMASSLDQIGTLTKTVYDSAILLNYIAGWDELDSTSKDKKMIDLSQIKKENKKIKIGIPKQCFTEGLDNEVEELFNLIIEKGIDYGFSIKRIDLPILDYALNVYYIIMPAELSSNLARYDGIKYGYSVINQKGKKYETLLDIYLNSRSEGFGSEIKRRIMLGTYVLSAGYYDAYYKKAQIARVLIKRKFQETFKNYDIILTPTSPTPAFKLGEKIDNPLTMYLSDIFTVPVNIAGLPAISIPAGRNKIGLPIGLQLIADLWEEEKLLNVAWQFEQIINY